MTLPNFLIIGAMKAGTTSLYNYLKQHPQIYMSHFKEPHFFSSKEYQKRGCSPILNIEEYRALFNDVSCQKAIGEASTTYLANSKAAERIRYYIPEAKLIAILRDPVDRAYSYYLMAYRQELNSYSVNKLLNHFLQVFQEDDHISNSGFYYRHLKHYLSLFDREQIKVFLYEDLKDNQKNLLQQTCQFLNVDDSFFPKPSATYYNKGGIPSNKTLHSFLEVSRQYFNKFVTPLLSEGLVEKVYQVYIDLRNRNLDRPPPLTREIRQQITMTYREDILQLQDLIQRDLSQWLE